MASSCKKCPDPHDICEECPEWIFTLADLIMCMMGLFVILWVLKPSGNPNSAEAAAKETEQRAEIMDAFGYKPKPDSTDPIDLYLMEKAAREARLKSGPDNGGRTRQENRGAEGTDTETTNIRPTRWATQGGRIGFAVGSAAIAPDAQDALNEIASRFRGHRNIVMIKGHTGSDDLPDTATPKEKLDLSLRRAQAIADYLVSKGVEPDILRVQGCSTFEPLIERAYTPEAKAQNRRAEIEATALLAQDMKEQPRPRDRAPALPAPASEPTPAP
jgi:outer membrane protein OmpA-like peptidoglycan-associated protein